MIYIDITLHCSLNYKFVLSYTFTLNGNIHNIKFLVDIKFIFVKKLVLHIYNLAYVLCIANSKEFDSGEIATLSSFKQ